MPKTYMFKSFKYISIWRGVVIFEILSISFSPSDNLSKQDKILS